MTAEASGRSSTSRMRIAFIGASVRRLVVARRRARSHAVNQNVLPSPGALSTPTSPPIAAARLRVSDRPRPVPPKRRVVVLSPCSNALNSSRLALGRDARAGVLHLEAHVHAAVAVVQQLALAAAPSRAR